jgi:rare lipoprotein A
MFGLAACASHAPQAALALPLPPPVPVMPAQTAAQRLSALPPIVVPAVRHPPLNLSGRRETGRASFYAQRFAGRHTASGERFNPHAASAASKTLPLGTVANVVNLANGESMIVTVNDRGPNVVSRILDVSPAVAGRLGMTREGVARVMVEPISIPEPDGAVKLGAGAASATPEQVRSAILATRRTMKETGVKVAGR